MFNILNQVDGKETLGENMADGGGIKMAYRVRLLLITRFPIYTCRILANIIVDSAWINKKYIGFTCMIKSLQKHNFHIHLPQLNVENPINLALYEIQCHKNANM